MNNRRRLQAARASVEAEAQMVLAVADREAVKEKAREAKKVLARFRKRGSSIQEAVRKLIDEYQAGHADAVALSNLGVMINPEIVRVNSARALRSALMPLRKELGLSLVPPLERHRFPDLFGSWTDSAERQISVILNEPPEVLTAPAELAEVVKQAMGN